MITVAVAGTPAWADEVEALRDLSVIRFTDRSGYVARLVDAGVALILVDGADADWRFWVTTPKVSPATRRIPVALVSDDARQREEARQSGANITLAAAELSEALPGLVAALSDDPAAQAAVEAQCDEPLPPDALEAVRRFNSGEFYKQHDLFEALWMQEERPIRRLYQGVLQVGIAYYQITLGNWRGAQKMILRSVQWLAALPDVCQGIDVAGLREDAARVREELARVGEAGIARFDRSLLKPVRIIEASGWQDEA
jgi:predicted metal-dependent hydrolase